MGEAAKGEVGKPAQDRPARGSLEVAQRLLRSKASACLLVAIAACLLRVLLLARAPFDGLYGQDAYFYLQASRELERIWGSPATLLHWATSWGTPPVSVWPLGYHLQMAVASLFTGDGPESGQAVSLVCGILAPVFTSLLFFALYEIDRTDAQQPDGPSWSVWVGGLLSGLIMACSALSVRSSVVVMSDMSGAMWAVLGALLVVLYSKSSTRSRGPGLLAGVCIGMAALTRYVYPLLLGPTLWQVGIILKARQSRITPGGLAREGLPIVLPVVVLVGLQLLHDAIHPTSGLPSPVIGTWSPLNAFQTQFDSTDGHLSYQTPMIFFFLLRPLYSVSALGPVFGVMALVGSVSLLRAGRATGWPITLGWWLLFALFYSGNVYQADRFVLSYLPPLALLAGLGLVYLVDLGASINFSRVLSRGGARKIAVPVWAALLALIALVGLSVQVVAAQRDYRELISQKDDYLQAAACAAEAHSIYPDVPLLSFGVTFTVRQYTSISPHELYDEDQSSVEQLLASSENGVRGLLVLPSNGFEAQWGTTRIGSTYNFLMSHYALEPFPCPGTAFSLFTIHDRR